MSQHFIKGLINISRLVYSDDTYFSGLFVFAVMMAFAINHVVSDMLACTHHFLGWVIPIDYTVVLFSSLL